VVVCHRDGRLAAGAQALVRPTRAGAITYVPRGPVCAPGDPAWPALHAALRDLAGNGVALRLEPNWADEPATRSWLADQGLREAPPIQPPSTVRLCLSPSEDDLLAAMKHKWRYNIRLAGRHGVEVVEGGEADLPTFGRLMAETAARDRFHARPTEYFAGAWRAFGGDARLYVAVAGGDALAAIMVFHFGDTATYLYGASASHARRHMPNHLLQWEAIRRARADGRRWYDFWGIPDEIGRVVVGGTRPEDIPPGQGGLWGVWGFKRGFGGEVSRTVAAWDEVYAPLRYRLGLLASRLSGGRASGR